MANRNAEREQFLADVIVSAVEGGTNYWAQVSEYHHSGIDPATSKNTYAVLHELTDDESSYKKEGMRLDVNAIARGIRRIVNRIPLDEHIGVNNTLRATIAAADRLNDAGEIDADGADVIAQAALLGEIKYG